MLNMGFVDHSLHDRFERGVEVSSWTLEYLVSGSTSLESNGREWQCRAPSLLLAPPHVTYSVKWRGEAGRWTEIFAMFDAPLHWRDFLPDALATKEIVVFDFSTPATASEIDTVLKKALKTQRLARIHSERLTFNALERALLLWDEIHPLRGHAQRDERIEQALIFISENYQRALNLESLARHVYLSPSRFSYLFRAQMQQAPMQYVEAYRLDRAAEKLLTTRDSVEHIARSVGLQNAFHFSTRFRYRFGHPPSRYRTNPKL